ncbi:hypothetical protein PISMIDRAFT_165972 [Pisolithus microcarpus 441]|uniref:Uncharacterized protein n=1 Tax=Pisolithus microcarpus 441 TaxID=765257 RepID=A0A0C9ZZM5_9AGAM|nr:hypothetical protein PISMIDRAFT_165972 [Pisolithus microcarpus 441]
MQEQAWNGVKMMLGTVHPTRNRRYVNRTCHGEPLLLRRSSSYLLKQPRGRSQGHQAIRRLQHSLSLTLMSVHPVLVLILQRWKALPISRPKADGQWSGNQVYLSATRTVDHRPQIVMT